MSDPFAKIEKHLFSIDRLDLPTERKDITGADDQDPRMYVFCFSNHNDMLTFFLTNLRYFQANNIKSKVIGFTMSIWKPKEAVT